MRSHFYIRLFGALCLLLLFGQSRALSQQEPVLYGQVLRTAGSSDKPLARAKLELLTSRNEVRYKAYSDPKGSYAFRAVAPGQYKLRVSYGRTLLQKTRDGWVTERPIALDRQPSRLIVRVRAP